jgi:rhamnose utilization protein RhaD (predicted bifunctional aldolase and dehydrogenase)
LGLPSEDCAILGEGNTSARAELGTFWIKASGACLAQLSIGECLLVRASQLLEVLELAHVTDDDLLQRMLESRVQPRGERRPSIETVLHAVLMAADPSVQFIAHTHPTAINAITCSKLFAEALAGRLFPDEVVVCGEEPLLVPYADPGVPLARELRESVGSYCKQRGRAPRTIYLQNHGLIATGATAQEVVNTTRMAVKAARIRIGSFAMGGPRYLTGAEVARIAQRPDEHHRQRVLASQPASA